MARKRAARESRPARVAEQTVSANADELLLAALEAGGDPTKTGRFLVTFKEGATEAGLQAMQAQGGMRVAHARDFRGQAVDFTQLGDADAVMFPEISVALVSGQAAAARSMTAAAVAAEDSPMQSVDPEYFM